MLKAVYPQRDRAARARKVAREFVMVQTRPASIISMAMAMVMPHLVFPNTSRVLERVKLLCTPTRHDCAFHCCHCCCTIQQLCFLSLELLLCIVVIRAAKQQLTTNSLQISDYYCTMAQGVLRPRYRRDDSNTAVRRNSSTSHDLVVSATSLGCFLAALLEINMFTIVGLAKVR